MIFDFIFRRRKKKKELQRRKSTRQLMGIDQITEHGVRIVGGELVFYFVQPDNLSVLSDEGIRHRVLSLSALLQAFPELTIMALDSRESFQQNKDWYRQRLEEETEPAVREILRQDMEHLDMVQAGTVSSREFIIQWKTDLRSAADPALLAENEKRIRNCGFRVHLADAQDVKRVLAVYYQQDVTTEYFEDFDGERAVKGYE